MAATNQELDEFLDTYPDAVRKVALEARKFIVAALPGAQEMVDVPDKVIGYGFGPGYADLICTIILSKGGVKLGIVRSAELPDPKGVLEGNGKLHRYVTLSEASDLKKPGVKQLLKAAVDAWKKRSKK